MRKLVVNIAMSLDGYIAREDGSYDWIEGHGTKAFDSPLQFDNDAFFASCDIVLMGRKSYEDCPIDMIPSYQDKTFYVASHQKQTTKERNIIFTDDIIKITKDLKAEDGGPIWLFGGAYLVEALLKEKLIDHYIIGIIPTILGSGRRLFNQQEMEHKLILVESTVTDGIAMLRYDNRH